MKVDRTTPFEAWFHGPMSKRTAKATAKRRIKWTAKMDKVLVRASEDINPLSWIEIAKALSLSVCTVRERYAALGLPVKERRARGKPHTAHSKRRITWTEEMDNYLVSISMAMRPPGWEEIAKVLRVTVPDVCVRYSDVLKLPKKEKMPRTTPIYNKIMWSEDMDAILIAASKNPTPPSWEALEKQIGVSMSSIQIHYNRELKLPNKRRSQYPLKRKNPAG